MSEREDILSGLPDIETSASVDAADTMPSEPVRASRGAHASKSKKDAKRGSHVKAREGARDETGAEDDPKAEDKTKADAKDGAGALSSLPTLAELEAERKRQGSKTAKRRIATRVGTIVVVAAALTAICVTFFTPVLGITGESMMPTLKQGNLVLCSRAGSYEQGDVIAFYLDNKVLVKRVIATEGQWVDIDKQGNVYVDGKMIDEPYVDEKAVGKCNIALPYLVDEDELFVMGDNRSNSIDSRSSSVGCVDSTQIMGKVFVRIVPPGGIA